MEEITDNNSSDREIRDRYNEFLIFSARQKLELSALIVHLQNAEKSLSILIDMDNKPPKINKNTKFKPLIKMKLKYLTTQVLEAYRTELKQINTKHPLDKVEAQRQTFLSHIMLYDRIKNLMEHPVESKIFLKIIDNIESGKEIPEEVSKWLLE